MEFMSNVSSGLDDYKPSLFELVSEHQLRDLLEPSLRYLLAIITQRHPRYLIHVVNRFDEAYALVMLLVERHYLRSWGGSFTENFYGLKREKMLSVKHLSRAMGAAPDVLREAGRLGRGDIWRSLFVIVGIPYIKRKLDDAYEIHAGGAAANLFGSNYRRDELRANATLKDKLIYYLKLLLRKTYPTINATYYLTTLAFNLLYLFDKTPYHTPFHYLINLRMRRLSEADHRAFETAARLLSPTNKSTTTTSGLPPALSLAALANPIYLSRVLLPTLLNSLKLILPTSIFFLKFLEWWHASDFARQLSSKTSSSIELPPPKIGATPPPPQSTLYQTGIKEGTLVELPEDGKTCGICKEDISNPTATQTGYVFCYPCVFRWVGGDVESGGREDRKGRCPVTGVRLLGGVEGLRRLMV